MSISETIDGYDEEYGFMSCRGNDSIGIEAHMTNFLYERGANLLNESTDVHNDYFTGTLVFSVKHPGVRRIEKDALVKLRQYDPVVRKIGRPQQPKRVTLNYVLDVVAEAEPGISVMIEQIMRTNGINMSEIRARAHRTYGYGRDIYRGSFRLEVGNAESLREVHRALKRLEEERGWEVFLQEESRPRRQFQVYTVGVPVVPGASPRLNLCEK